jgi:hypothetical protein
MIAIAFKILPILGDRRIITHAKKNRLAVSHYQSVTMFFRGGIKVKSDIVTACLNTIAIKISTAHGIPSLASLKLVPY